MNDVQEFSVKALKWRQSRYLSQAIKYYTKAIESIKDRDGLDDETKRELVAAHSGRAICHRLRNDRESALQDLNAVKDIAPESHCQQEIAELENREFETTDDIQHAVRRAVCVDKDVQLSLLNLTLLHAKWHAIPDPTSVKENAVIVSLAASFFYSGPPEEIDSWLSHHGTQCDDLCVEVHPTIRGQILAIRKDLAGRFALEKLNCNRLLLSQLVEDASVQEELKLLKRCTAKVSDLRNTNGDVEEGIICYYESEREQFCRELADTIHPSGSFEDKGNLAAYLSENVESIAKPRFGVESGFRKLVDWLFPLR